MNYLLDLALHVSSVCSYSICILKRVPGNLYCLSVPFILFPFNPPCLEIHLLYCNNILFMFHVWTHQVISIVAHGRQSYCLCFINKEQVLKEDSSGTEVSNSGIISVHSTLLTTINTFILIIISENY